MFTRFNSMLTLEGRFLEESISVFTCTPFFIKYFPFCNLTKVYHAVYNMFFVSAVFFLDSKCTWNQINPYTKQGVGQHFEVYLPRLLAETGRYGDSGLSAAELNTSLPVSFWITSTRYPFVGKDLYLSAFLS